MVSLKILVIDGEHHKRLRQVAGYNALNIRSETHFLIDRAYNDMIQEQTATVSKGKKKEVKK